MWLQLNVPNLVDDHYLLQDPTYDNTSMFYGLPQYHQHHPTNYYVPYVAFQAKPPSQLPSSSSHGVSSDHFWITHGELIKEKHIRNTHESSVLRNYAGHHPFPPPGSIWYDQQHHGRSDGSPSFWPLTPYVLTLSLVLESSSRNPAPFMNPSQLNPRNHYYSHHHPLVQGVRGQSAILFPPMASSPPLYRGPIMGPVQPTGCMIYQNHQRDDSVPLETLRQHLGGVPRLRVMPDDEVAIFEFGDFLGGYVHNHIDHHRDMRLDIEKMSYELLALSERIGTVNTDLPEEDVKNHLKTRTCFGTNLAQTIDRETTPCIICQASLNVYVLLESFKKEEKIATLDYGHEYHAECLEND
ncbi:hypothetical protein Bca52824_038837 [Brassica carinata]|uniref:RING-type E3 ubiquitin transferase n=1 Tax=Brassica carinata TaxID=52824 RepID=A0A8X7RQF5_BRACI|nr:hypothetical protein Bca52824_038837 [Brassica carinata]